MQTVSPLPSPTLLPGPTPSLRFSFPHPFGSLPSFLAFAQDAPSARKLAFGPPACDLNLDFLAESPGLTLYLSSQGFFLNYCPEDSEAYPTY